MTTTITPITCQDPVVSASLEGSVYRNVPGYDAKYFPKSFQQTVMNLLPTPAQSPSELLRWLDDFQHQQHGTAHNSFVPHSIKGKPELASCIQLSLVRASASEFEGPCPDATILVLGLIQTGIDFSLGDKAVLRFYDLAVGAFTARPDRRFLFAFLVYNSTMEMWTFDRAGAYSGKAFDIVEEPHRFRSILAGYMSMDDDELGLNTFLQKDEQGVFVELKEQNLSSGRRLSVDKDAFVKQDYLVGPSTTCFKARISNSIDQELAVKFVWAQSEVSAERRLLQFANEKNVWGVLRFEGYQDLGDIGQLRQGLQFGQPYEFSLPRPKAEDSSNRQTLPETTAELPPLRQAFGGPIKHEKGLRFDNLKFECIVTSPLGRPLNTFSSLPELMMVLRDTVKALRSLHLEVNILHRDVSPQKIIIAPNMNQDPNTPTGILIGLDMALDLSNPPSERLLIGSEGFMAIGILGGDDHTYRHDLESLFYVLLWMAICHDGANSEQVPATSRLRAWLGKDYSSLTAFYSQRKDMQPM